MFETVQKWKNVCLRSNRRFDRIDRTLQIVGFTAQDDEIKLFAMNSIRRHGFNFQRGVALRTFNAKSLGFQILFASGANKESNVGAAFDKTSTKISADAARSENQNFHITYFLEECRGPSHEV